MSLTIVSKPGDVFTLADGRQIHLTPGSVLQVADGSIATAPDGKRSKPLGERLRRISHRPTSIN